MAEQTIQSSITERTVVSSFLFKMNEAEPKVALFRRSAKVRTYQHRLAPISGSVDKDDASPVAAAWREIKEETTLTSTSLALLRQGKSYTFTDDLVGRRWTIIPFLFRLKTAEEGGSGEQGIQINWEHDDWGWYDPYQVTDSPTFGGVPRLARSLGRVFLAPAIGARADKVLSKGLETLQKDYHSGARQLAAMALQILRDVIQELELDSRRPSWHWWVAIRYVAWHIWKNGRESMGAAIMAILLAALQKIDLQRETLAADGSANRWKPAVLANLDELLTRRGAESAKQISGGFTRYIKESFAAKLASSQPLSVLTLSDSSTITLCLHHLLVETDFSLDLRVLESRPLFEGVSLVARLVQELQSTKAADKISVTVYADAAAAFAAQGVDVALIGADRIAQSGAVSNKAGSLPAILTARHVAFSHGVGLKTVVLAEAGKVAPPADISEHIVEENDPEQLMQTWKGPGSDGRVREAANVISRFGKMITMRNVYFEWVPSDLLDVYITDLGVWTVEDVARHSDLIGAEEKRMFDDL